MSEIFIVTKIDFDNLENRDPICKKQLGFLYSNQEVEAYIAKQQLATYKGYDGQLYPKYSVTAMKELK